MEGNKKIGFFKKFYLIITDFRIYPLISKEKFSNSFAYYIKLLLLVTFVFTLIISINLFDILNNIIANYDNIPNFTFNNGELNIENKIIIEDNKNTVIIDTNRNLQDYLEGEMGQGLNLYDSYVLIDKNEAYVYNGYEGNSFNFKDYGITITKQSLLDFFVYIRTNFYIKVLLFISIFLGIFVAFFVINTINVIILAILAGLVNALFRSELKFSNYLKISMSILTLPIIVEIFAIIATGGIPYYAYITYYILAYVYLFYALRAITLDYIITNIPGDSIKDKIKKMVEQVESEIEDKMKESEEKNKEDEENKEEKDSNEKGDK
jgi:hypothetical protein